MQDLLVKSATWKRRRWATRALAGLRSTGGVELLRHDREALEAIRRRNAASRSCGVNAPAQSELARAARTRDKSCASLNWSSTLPTWVARICS